MTSPFQIPADTLQKQERVSDPSVSAWVSANAGAGKTTVLVRRVIRLLLAGNTPARILCLTFTKAAAANMANKVLETLSRWVRLDDAALDAAIREVSPLAPTPALRATARRLFAQALETPGGLKVQTIHAFCDRVLHQFPMEAGVQAGFDVLDDVQEDALLRRARESVLIAAANNPDSALGQALGVAVAAASDESFGLALEEAVRGRRKIARLADLGGAAAIARALGLEPGDSVAAVVRDILNGPNLARSEWLGAATALLSFTGNAAKRARGLQEAANAGSDEESADVFLNNFFTDKGKPYEEREFGSKDVRAALPDLHARLLAERDRLVPLRDRLSAARALERTSALVTLASATIDKFENEKRARGALDYSDLIEKTADMLADTGSAWVLYKLDGGIDHVLIDEAQDTSPEQWSVIERLTEEFFAGTGARADRERTIFVVGDDKQSIFSFQGANPRLFGEKREDFGRRVTEFGQPFFPEDLLLSFRSARGVLAAVDTVFERVEAHRGLSSGGDGKTIHEAIRANAPALVEIWDLEEPADNEEDGLAWDAPIDARSEASPIVRLAQRIARAVKHCIEGGLAIEDRRTRQLRALTAGDVIVLVRRRGPLFEAILQALKKADVPVAGADRLKLSEHIAVMDLMALGDALLLEADDFALACALKSPLFGVNEDDLLALAHNRAGTLAASLEAQAGNNPRFRAANEKITRWRKEAASLRPFDFYSRVLGRDKGREQILARLGHEAADAIDEFLARALAYEQTETPSLAGFLNFLRRAGTEVKRDLEVESDAVRVMTVHGAKGLEAPLVVLADTTSIPDGRHERLLDLPNSEAFVWAGKKALDSTREEAARLVGDELREAEYRRLLYVALTRAADALIVCGAKGTKKIDDGCWYRLVRDALETDSGLIETSTRYAEKVWRWRPQETGQAQKTAAKPKTPSAAVPWLTQAAPGSPPAPRRVAPSRVDPEDEPVSPYLAARATTLDPRLRGDLLHRLLQRLPEVELAKRQDSALKFLAGAAAEIAEAEREKLVAEALRVIDHPDLRELFGPGSRAEVDLLANFNKERPAEISGRIDRLAVTEKFVIIADFKTGRPPNKDAEPARNYLEQLAVYRAVLACIYPNRAMRCMLVWTENAAIQEIAADRLEAASRGLFPATGVALTPGEGTTYLSSDPPNRSL